LMAAASASSYSVTLRSPSDDSFTPKASAVVCNSFRPADSAVRGYAQRTAAREALGRVSLSSSNRLLLSSVLIIDSPVTFPPGREGRATRPDPPGASATATMGIIAVALFAAKAAAVVSVRSHQL